MNFSVYHLTRLLKLVSLGTGLERRVEFIVMAEVLLDTSKATLLELLRSLTLNIARLVMAS